MRLPSLYSLQACPVRYPLITISTIKGSHLLPIVTDGSGVDSFQFWTMSEVASKNLDAIWFSTCPLYGIPSGRTWSNADILSDAIITNCSSPILYTSLTFPLYKFFWFGKLKSVLIITLLLIFVLF